MKKLILSLMILMTACSQAFAYYPYNAYSRPANTSTGVAMTNLNVANASTTYSETIFVGDNVGFSAILVAENKAGGAGSVTVTVEYSIDQTNFYTVYTPTAGVLTADSAIVTTLANQTRYIQYPARLGPYIRYKFVAAADSAITLTYIYQKGK